MTEVEIKLIAYMLSEGSAQSAISVTTSLPEVAADLKEIAAAFEMQLVCYPKRGSCAAAYRFTNNLHDRLEARAELAIALRRAQKHSGISWSELAKRVGIGYSLLNAWRRGLCVPSEAELHALAVALNCSLTDLAPGARHRAESNTPIARFLEQYKLRCTRAADKAVPDCIFRLPRDQLALFLRALFTGDGSVFVNQRGLAGLSYSTISRRLAEDVQHLLLRFGIVTKLRVKHHSVNGMDYISYKVMGVGAKRTQMFVEQIGIMGRAPALAALGTLSPEFESSQTDTVPMGEAFWTMLKEATGELAFRDISQQAGVIIRNRRREHPLRRTTISRLAEAFPHPRLVALGSGDVYWDEIVAIEPDGTAQVYDLTVPHYANFVANDLVVHNSTLLMQLAASQATANCTVLYASGEESVQQLKMRADRIGLASEHLFLVTETNLDTIIAHILETRPNVVVVDSIQTMYLEELTSAAGSISQVREGASRLQQLAKSSNIAVFIVGHVTKAGAIAGPKVLEHIVDTVLYLEGERFHTYRLLRSVKNRFGATSEVGVFEMRGDGMVEVINPSEAFLSERLVAAPGSSIAVTMEGTRPLLVEVQALTSTTSFGLPRRTPNGIDFNRLLLLVAVLQKRCGIRLHDQDVFVNVVGGLRIDEPAADLAVAAAIASSMRDTPVAPDVAFIGEVGLSGELRSVGQLQPRLNEAAKLGFKRCLVPKGMRRGREDAPKGLELIGARSLGEALELAVRAG
jgi:DNA repair protein RadA/Sms